MWLYFGPKNSRKTAQTIFNYVCFCLFLSFGYAAPMKFDAKVVVSILERVSHKYLPVFNMTVIIRHVTSKLQYCSFTFAVFKLSSFFCQFNLSFLSEKKTNNKNLDTSTQDDHNLVHVNNK